MPEKGEYSTGVLSFVLLVLIVAYRLSDICFFPFYTNAVFKHTTYKRESRACNETMKEAGNAFVAPPAFTSHCPERKITHFYA